MTCNITNTPLYLEPLPLYRRDPETASIRSAAPSYVSEAPTYTSRRQSQSVANNPSPAARPSPTTRTSSASTSPPRQGLPSPRYAPGFQSRAHGSSSDLSAHNYNISHWSNIHGNHQSRQYANVARRRASQAANTTAILNSLSAVPTPAIAPPTVSAVSTSVSPNASSTALNNAGSTLTPTGAGSPAASTSTGGSSAYPSDVVRTPTSPLEDPYLVGEEAAGRARAQRIYREMCLRDDEAVRHESKTWDFMLSQMADWEERERSWGKFRESVGRTKLLGRRIGLRGYKA